MGEKIPEGMLPTEAGEGDFECDVDMKDDKDWEIQVRENISEKDGIPEVHVTYKDMGENRNFTIGNGKNYDKIDWSKG